MELDSAQKQHLYEDGYLSLPGVVPRTRVDSALRAINNAVGEGMDPAQMQTFRAQTYCPELRDSPFILDLLYETPIWSAAESLIGPEQIRRATGGQIALRFPRAPGAEPSAPSPHIDGLYSPTNGVREGDLASFTMLIGVLLSDLPATNAGNFTVWPGTHRLYEQYFREHGTDALFRGAREAMPPIPLPDPVQITGQAGDAVLCHYQLAHAVAANVSPHVRYAIFFRLSHVEHAQHKMDALTDIWLAWRGMRERE